MNNLLEWWEARRGDYAALLFDIDGTLLTAGECLPGADALLRRLRQLRYPFYLLTNDGNHSVEEKSVLMGRVGLYVEPAEIVSCSMALRQFAARRHYQGHSFFILGDLGKPCFAEQAGLVPCRDLARIDECSGVIVGEGVYDWQNYLTATLNFLVHHPDRPLVAPNPDSYWPASRKGTFGIGAGAKVRFLCGLLAEMGIDVQPIYLGKPYPAIYDYAVSLLQERYGFPEIPEMRKIVMVGDSLTSDICGANRLGMTSALVLTGITTAAQASAAEAELRPHFVFNTLG